MTSGGYHSSTVIQLDAITAHFRIHPINSRKKEEEEDESKKERGMRNPDKRTKIYKRRMEIRQVRILLFLYASSSLVLPGSSSVGCC